MSKKQYLAVVTGATRGIGYAIAAIVGLLFSVIL